MTVPFTRRTIGALTLALSASGMWTGTAHAQPASPSPRSAGAPRTLQVERILVTSAIRYRVLDQQELLSRTTITDHFGSLQSIDGMTLTISPGVRVMRHGQRYFVVPEGSRFSTAFYGHFCGAGWGAGSGNDSRVPLADGGLDAACRAHDRDWERASTPRDVLAADARFVETLARVQPTWSYEAEYRDAALRWMSCRRANAVHVKSFKEARCGAAAVWPVVRSSVSQVLRR